ncbi:MAG: SGNH/GDSL hydrolase family protein [Candidatus Melainabacteria bacterium]|nr:SGNH/GDSL hydrolase family protein [Candidatus Melainabacteria bacterium]
MNLWKDIVGYLGKFNYKDLVINISLSLVTVFFCTLVLIVIVEARHFIRMKQYLKYVWHDPNTQFDSELGWSPVKSTRIIYPGWGNLTTNSQGFRSNEIDENKKQIIVLGDSVAWGIGVGDKETFPYYLEKMVSNLGYQVSNLAVSGYDIGQYYLFLKRHINKFNNLKQVILVICTDNDPEGTGMNYDYGKRKPLFRVKNDDLILTNSSIKKYCLRNLFSKSFFLSRLESYEGVIGTILSKLSGDKYLSEHELRTVSLLLFQRIYDLVSSHGAKLLIVLSPSKDDFVKKSYSLEWLEIVCNNVTKKDFQCLDYIGTLKKEKQEPSGIYLPSDQVHYSKKGNILLAQTVYDYLYMALD